MIAIPVRAVLHECVVVRSASKRSWKKRAPGKIQCTIAHRIFPGARILLGKSHVYRNGERIAYGMEVHEISEAYGGADTSECETAAVWARGTSK